MTYSDHLRNVYDKLKNVNTIESVLSVETYKEITECDREFLKIIPFPIMKNKAYISSDGLRVFKVLYIEICCEYKEKDTFTIVKNWENSLLNLFPNNEGFCRIALTHDTKSQFDDWHQFLEIYVGYWADNTLNSFIEYRHAIL